MLAWNAESDIVSTLLEHKRQKHHDEGMTDEETMQSVCVLHNTDNLNRIQVVLCELAIAGHLQIHVSQSSSDDKQAITFTFRIIDEEELCATDKTMSETLERWPHVVKKLSE